MPTLTDSLRHFLPEAILALGAALAFLSNIGAGRRGRRGTPATIVALAALAGAGVATALDWPEVPAVLFGGMVRLDAFAGVFKMLLSVAGILGILMTLGSREIPDADWGEFLGLMLTLILGAFLLAMGQNLLMIYLSIEAVSICSFALAGMGTIKERRMAEGALKYVIFGGVASGLMLFGISWLYGLTGTLDLAGTREAIGTLGVGGPARWALVLALVMTLAGFGYKIAAVPFHQWSPDTYEGAPTPFVGFLSTGPKAAGFAVLVRFVVVTLLDPATLEPIDGGAAAVPIVRIIAVIAIATMTLGNVTAIAQRNVKRMLAYSSIAHAGYMLLGLTALSGDGITSVVLYLWIYLFMNLGAFLVVTAVNRAVRSEDISAYRGLGRRAPLLAILMAIFLFSLTGLPPLSGFVAKFYLFAALIEIGDRFHYALVVIGVLNSVVSLYYYAAVVKAMFMDKSDDGPFLVPAWLSVLAVAMAIPVVVLGIYWAPLRACMDWVMVGFP